MKHAAKTTSPPCWHNDDALLARRLIGLALAFAVLGCLALTIDTLAGWVFLGEAGPIWHVLRKGLKRLVNPTESFANGLGIILILLALFAADVAHRRGLLRAVVVIFGAGILANVVKCCIGRTRPKILFDVDADQFTSGVIASFQGWLPLWKLGYPGQSFPSGHTTAAVALAIVLCRRWPRGSWAFITLAIMAGLQRMAFGHHYPSDCLWARPWPASSRLSVITRDCWGDFSAGLNERRLRVAAKCRRWTPWNIGQVHRPPSENIEAEGRKPSGV